MTHGRCTSRYVLETPLFFAFSTIIVSDGKKKTLPSSQGPFFREQDEWFRQVLKDMGFTFKEIDHREKAWVRKCTVLATRRLVCAATLEGYTFREKDLERAEYKLRQFVEKNLYPEEYELDADFVPGKYETHHGFETANGDRVSFESHERAFLGHKKSVLFVPSFRVNINSVRDRLQPVIEAVGWATFQAHKSLKACGFLWDNDEHMWYLDTHRLRKYEHKSFADVAEAVLSKCGVDKDVDVFLLRLHEAAAEADRMHKQAVPRPSVGGPRRISPSHSPRRAQPYDQSKPPVTPAQT